MWEYAIVFLIGLNLGGWAMYAVVRVGLKKLMKDRVLVFGKEELDND